MIEDFFIKENQHSCKSTLAPQTSSSIKPARQTSQPPQVKRSKPPQPRRSSQSGSDDQGDHEIDEEPSKPSHKASSKPEGPTTRSSKRKQDPAPKDKDCSASSDEYFPERHTVNLVDATSKINKKTKKKLNKAKKRLFRKAVADYQKDQVYSSTSDIAKKTTERTDQKIVKDNDFDYKVLSDQSKRDLHATIATLDEIEDQVEDMDVLGKRTLKEVSDDIKENDKLPEIKEKVLRKARRLMINTSKNKPPFVHPPQPLHANWHKFQEIVKHWLIRYGTGLNKIPYYCIICNHVMYSKAESVVGKTIGRYMINLRDVFVDFDAPTSTEEYQMRFYKAQWLDVKKNMDIICKINMPIINIPGSKDERTYHNCTKASEERLTRSLQDFYSKEFLIKAGVITLKEYKQQLQSSEERSSISKYNARRDLPQDSESPEPEPVKIKRKLTTEDLTTRLDASVLKRVDYVLITDKAGKSKNLDLDKMAELMIKFKDFKSKGNLK
jgi:hypothetical protein